VFSKAQPTALRLEGVKYDGETGEGPGEVDIADVPRPRFDPGRTALGREDNSPMILDLIGVMQAINRHRV
jgi:hypothetical protein